MHKLNEEKMFYDDSDEQVIIINFATGVYYSFDKISSAVMKDLIAGVEPESILKGLLGLKGCPDNIKDRLFTFINKLKNLEMIITSEERTNAGQPIYNQAITGDGYEFTVDGFEEIADLLLTDPIHEINEDIGWPVKKNAN